MDLSNFLKHVKEEGLDLFNLVIYQNDQKYHFLKEIHNKIIYIPNDSVN